MSISGANMSISGDICPF